MDIIAPMKRPVWLIVGVVAIALIAWFALRSGSGESVAIDLVNEFPRATDKRPRPDVFAVGEATLAGVTKRVISVEDPGGSRLVYSVTVPDNGALRVSVGLKEQGWTVEGDGVLFRVLLGAGAPPEEILNLVINPFGNPADRRWQDLELDLSEYAGETINLFFNTNSSPSTRPPTDNRNGDLAVWGEPRIVAR
jgi:hypothetical protein